MDKKLRDQENGFKWILGSYRLRKSLHSCQKLTIGNLLEILKYKITGFKHSQLPTGILQNNYNEIMRES